MENKHKKQLIEPSSLIIASLLSSAILGSCWGFNRYLKQIKSAREIPRGIMKKRWLYGKVTAVGDGDNFHLFHMPGGILGGWGWLRTLPRLEKNNADPSKKKKKRENALYTPLIQRLLTWRNKKNSERSKYYLGLASSVKGKRNLPTIAVRLCGIDAPERAHFGNPSQPFSDEALCWLRYKLLGKRIWIKPLSIDQYNRCVARAAYWSWLSGWRDISLEMLKEGLAVVYEGKTGAEFDGREQIYRFHEFVAKSRKKGMWVQNKMVTPGQYKRSNT